MAKTIRYKLKLVLILVSVLFLMVVSRCFAVEVKLGWDANSEEDLAGYNLHYGTASGNYTTSIDVGNVTEFTIQNLNKGTVYYFAATAYDTDNNESDYSNEVSYSIADDNTVLWLSEIPEIIKYEKTTYFCTSDIPVPINWNPISAVNNYRVEAYHFERQNLKVITAETSNNQIQLIMPKTGHYTFKVFALYGDGSSVELSNDSWWIYVTAAPPGPIIIE